jgi:hypothetical protein
MSRNYRQTNSLHGTKSTEFIRITYRPARKRGNYRNVAQVGRLERREETGDLPCLVCGVRLQTLVTHVRVHAMTTQEYRDRFGADVLLVSKSLTDRLVAHVAAVKNARRLATVKHCLRCGAVLPTRKIGGKWKKFCSFQCMGMGWRTARRRRCARCHKLLPYRRPSETHSKKAYHKACYREAMRDIMTAMANESGAEHAL